MIISIDGDLGSGKTLLMTHLGKLMYEDAYNVFSNYSLTFDHTRIESLKDINSIEGKRNVLLFDELWITADARKSMQFTNMMLSSSVLQSRKKHTDILYTTQFLNQVDSRIRNITSFNFSPTILARDEKEIPMVIRVNISKPDRNGNYGHFKTSNIFIYGSHNFYNTDEFIFQTESNQYKQFTDKYKDSELKKSELLSVLMIDESLNKTNAEIVANYIKTKQK